jgi:hypothetical protein
MFRRSGNVNIGQTIAAAVASARAEILAEVTTLAKAAANQIVIVDRRRVAVSGPIV